MRTFKPKFNANIFLYRRLRDERYKKQAEDLLIKFLSNKSVCISDGRLHSHCKPDELISSTPKKNLECKSRPSIKIGTRFVVKPKTWHLPPDRYSLPSLLQNKGGFISKLARTEETIIRHNRPMKELGEFRYYTIAGFTDKLKNRCYNYKGIFTSNPRHRRPTARSMIHDINYAERSPGLGPATYCLKQGNFGSKKVAKAKPLFIYQFYTNSAVPVTENVIYGEAQYFGSDPTAYYPYHTSKCPIIGKCDPDIVYKIEVNKRRKSRRLPYNKLLVRLNIETDFESHIKGHGHISKFICSAECNRTKLIMKRSQKELVFNYLGLDYLKMITNPNRKIISFRDPDTIMPTKPIIITYMATSKPVIRKKLLETPNLAFNSTQPRWKDDKPRPVVEKPPEKKSIQKIKKIKIKKEVKSKLYDIKPRGTILTRNVSTLMKYKFSKEPPSKLLVPSNFIGDFGTKPIQFFLQDLVNERFFKDKL